MVGIATRQFHLRHLFGLTALAALVLGIWLPDVGELARRYELTALLIILIRIAFGWVAIMAAARHVRLLPPLLRRLPLEFQVLAGLLVLVIALIAVAILLPPLP